MSYENNYIADDRERTIRARRVGVRRLLSGLVVFVASLVAPGFLPPQLRGAFGWIGWLPGAWGLAVALDGIALLVNPARLDHRPPIAYAPDAAAPDRAERPEGSLPPAVGYGIVFAAAGILFGVLAYMMYF